MLIEYTMRLTEEYKVLAIGTLEKGTIVKMFNKNVTILEIGNNICSGDSHVKTDFGDENYYLGFDSKIINYKHIEDIDDFKYNFPEYYL